MRELQTWMLKAITAPLPPRAAETKRRILPSETLNAQERLSLYRDMYRVRMIEAMETDYPALAALTGPRRFRELVLDYIQRHPSRSYTLNRLGDSFPDVLVGFERDLARLELAMTEVFDEEESPPVDLAELARAGDLATARLETIRAMRLLQFDYPVNDVFSRFRDGKRLRRPQPRRTWLCVYRRDYSVIRMPLSEPAFACLGALGSGLPVASALPSAVEADEVFGWFHAWSVAGLFSKIA